MLMDRISIKAPTTSEIRAVIEKNQPVRVSEIIQLLGVSRQRQGTISTIRHTLSREIKVGHVVRTPDGYYSLGREPASSHSRREDVAKYLETHSPCTLSEICDSISCNPNSVRKHLKALNAKYIMDMHGRKVLW